MNTFDCYFDGGVKPESGIYWGFQIYLNGSLYKQSNGFIPIKIVQIKKEQTDKHKMAMKCKRDVWEAVKLDKKPELKLATVIYDKLEKLAEYGFHERSITYTALKDDKKNNPKTWENEWNEIFHDIYERLEEENKNVDVIIEMKSTNNEAEYCALNECLRQLDQDDLINDSNQTEITIHGDSKLIVNQANNKWKIKAKNLWEPWKKTRELSKSLKNKSKLIIEHIPREKPLQKKVDAWARKAKN